jgi:hypothetical protein
MPSEARRGRGDGSGNAQGVALGNRLAQQVYQSVVDARVLDASGREQKFHGVQARVVRQIRRRNKSEQEGGRKGTTTRLL